MDAKTVDLSTLNTSNLAQWAVNAAPPEFDLMLSRLNGEYGQHLARRDRASQMMKRWPEDSTSYASYAKERARSDGLAQWYGDLGTVLDGEWTARGGWTRYYLVRGANGHVHWTTRCQTCNRNGQATDFTWLTQYSGMPMHEFVNLAGERACTVCFPDAPVEKRSMLDDDVAERERLEAVRAERARKKQEKRDKAIAFDEDDEPTYLKCANGERPKTKISADRVAVAAWSRYLHLQAGAKEAEEVGHYEYRDHLESLASVEAATVGQIVDALGLIGHDTGTVEAGYKAKGEKMYAKRGY